MAESREIDRRTFQAVVALLGDHPELDVDQLRSLLERSGRRRNADPIRPQTAGELVALVQAGIITKAEAKRFLRLPRPVTRRPPKTGGQKRGLLR